MRLKLSKGDTMHVSETPDGIALTPRDPSLQEQVDMGCEFMPEYRDTVRALAE